jgi:hypothetical protein
MELHWAGPIAGEYPRASVLRSGQKSRFIDRRYGGRRRAAHRVKEGRPGSSGVQFDPQAPSCAAAVAFLSAKVARALILDAGC